MIDKVSSRAFSDALLRENERLRALVKMFEQFPLRAKKLRDFLIWREAVRLLGQGRNGQQRLARLSQELRAVKQYECSNSSCVDVLNEYREPVLFES